MNFYDFLTQKIKAFDNTIFIEGKMPYSYKNLYEDVLLKEASLKGLVGEKILLVSTNNTFFISSYLAILKTGNICVPIDTKSNIERISYIAKECHIRYAFIDEKVKRLDHLDAIKNLSSLVPNTTDFASNVAQTQDLDPAVIIYTSGSTGRPKGVVLTHLNLRSNTDSIVSYLGIKREDRQMVVLPFFYSYGLSLLNTFLRQNASLVINLNLVFPKLIIDDMKKYDVTFMAGVPSVYQMLINKTKFLEYEFPHLRCMTQAGGHLSSSYKEKIISAQNKIKFITMYGATEATARLTFLSAEELSENIDSIGEEIPGVEIILRKKDGTLAKIDEEGEICASGDNIMSGYYNDENLTRETIKDGYLLTGDIGKRDKNGNIFIVGREKNFIKSYGYRVVPQEIENYLSKIDGVLECAITNVEDEDAGHVMIAHIVLDQKSELNIKKIKLRMNKECPAYKCPKGYKILESLPKSSAGKIMRKLLT